MSTSKTHYYATWATFVFLKASVPSWFGRRNTVRSQDTLVWRKLWLYYKSTFISQKPDRMLRNISNLTLLLLFPSQLSRRKACTLLYLLPSNHGNPPLWTIYLASLLPSMVMTVYLWSWIDFMRWLYWWSVEEYHSRGHCQTLLWMSVGTFWDPADHYIRSG